MHPIELTFYKLVSKEIELSDFENWVYTEKTLEQFLNPDDYLEIISINYKTPSGLYEAQKVLSKYFSMGKYYEWSGRCILHTIIEKPDDAYKYIEQCYDLYCEGFDFMDNLGLGYGLGLTCSDDFNDKVDEFYPDIADEATRVILWLDSGKIIITGHSGEYRGIEYDDNRSTKEKEPTCYKRQKSKKVVAVLVVNTANKRFNQGRKQQACAPSPLILACSPVKRGVMCTRSCSEY